MPQLAKLSAALGRDLNVQGQESSLLPAGSAGESPRRRQLTVDKGSKTAVRRPKAERMQGRKAAAS